ncbi:hypothetical protein HID58_054124 [Brassica napus]|uniref:MATH domain-containing protein n=1 Tax=Brassica napus TaxID=3708 RepID=A0ABQ8AGN0_BRANA|nr:hypothetical protein HID58_054124 [Brassica napus]
MIGTYPLYQLYKSHTSLCTLHFHSYIQSQKMKSHYTNIIYVVFLLFCLLITSSSAQSLIRQPTDDLTTILQQEKGAQPNSILGEAHYLNKDDLDISSRDYKGSPSNLVTGMRDRPPMSYSLRMESFNTLLQSNETERYESRPFPVGGYNWSLIVYPNGNRQDSGSGFISLYVAIDNSTLVSSHQEVFADLRFYVFKRTERNFFTVQDTDVWRYNIFKTMWGFPRVLPLDTFRNPSNGYLFDGDNCEFGVDVTVHSPFESSELFTVSRNFPNPRFTWTIQRFSTLVGDTHLSNTNIQVNPRGRSTGAGRAMSMYLILNANEKVRPNEKIYVRARLRVINQRIFSLLWTTIERPIDHWFTTPGLGWGYDEFISLDDLRDFWKGYVMGDVLIVEVEMEAISSTKYFPKLTIDCFKGIYTTRSKTLREYLQYAICRGLNYGSISGIRLIMVRVKVVKDLYIRAKQRIKKRDISRTEGHGATNRDDYKDQARWSSPSIQDFGNLSKSEVYIWTSDHGRWIDSEHIRMAPNRRFPHSHEISSYLNESAVIGTDWVMVMEHIRSMNSLRLLLCSLYSQSSCKMTSHYGNTISIVSLLFCLYITSASARSFIRQYTDDVNTNLQREWSRTKPKPGREANYEDKYEEISSRDYKVSASNAVKGLRDRPPSSYILKMESFNTLLKSNYAERYESRPFADDNSTLVAAHQEVLADLRFYIFNNNERKFNVFKTMWGFSQVLPVDTFKDPKNGYLYDGDHCEFGVDVIIPSIAENSELFSATEKFYNPTFTWTIRGFSTLLKDMYSSDVFTIGGRMYPNGRGEGEGKFLSMFLKLNGEETLRPYEKVYVRAKLRVLNQSKLNNVQNQLDSWFSRAAPSWGFRKFISFDDLRDSSKGFLVNDVLMVQVEMEAVSSTKYFP